jgi:hypothetical protein
MYINKYLYTYIYMYIGYIKIEDFVRFAEDGKDVDDDYPGNVIVLLIICFISYWIILDIDT